MSLDALPVAGRPIMDGGVGGKDRWRTIEMTEAISSTHAALLHSYASISMFLLQVKLDSNLGTLLK